MSELLYPTYTVEDSKYQDYVGFIFNGKHSSDLGIVRTSNGSRFDENLLPTIQDKTVQVPGGDGTYFFGSYYTQKQFTIPFAFDSLTEEKFKELKNWLGDKKIHDLIFDEAPYKIYKAKVTGSATIKHIPFGEGETNRLYKGEGSIQFTCYQPYARSRFKTLEEYKYTKISISEGDFEKDKYYKKDGNGAYILAEEYEEGTTYYESWYKNIDEWYAASGILNASDYADCDRYDNSDSKSEIKLYNPGSINTHFKLKLIFSEEYVQINTGEDFVYEPGKYYIKNENGEYEISYEANTENKITYYLPQKKPLPAGGISLEENSLYWKSIVPKEGDVYIKIDTKLNLIEGYNAAGTKSGKIYNEYIESGSFFKIPTTEVKTSEMAEFGIKATISGEYSKDQIAIEYDYYYL